MEIYLYQNDKQVGPYTEQQLRDMLASGAIGKTESAWHEGLGEWQPLDKVISFAPVAPAFPPPPKQITSPALVTPRSHFNKAVIIVPAILLVFIIGIVALRKHPFGNKPPSSDFAAIILQRSIQQNAKGCIKLVDCQKTNGVENISNGQKSYELDCTATIEFLHDCYWDWNVNFYTDPSPLAGGFMINGDHEIIEKPRQPLPPSSGMEVNVYGASAFPAMRHYWYKGNKANIQGLKFNFEMTEQGWRDSNGYIFLEKWRNEYNREYNR
jgi:hypothetical protein